MATQPLISIATRNGQFAKPVPIQKPLAYNETLDSYVEACLADFQQHHCHEEKFELSRLGIRDPRSHHFHVYKATSQNFDLVMKLHSSNAYAHKFQREILAQTRLSEHFNGLDGLAVPKIRYASRPLQYFVMDFVEGVGTHAAIRDHVCPRDEDSVFWLAGKWLAELHSIRATQQVPFAPGGRIKTLLDTLNRSKSSSNKVHKQQQLISFAQKLLASASVATGLPSPVVLGHGDFHGDNLVFRGDTCTGIDFYNVRRLSAGTDIARFLVHADLSQFESTDFIGPLGIVQSHQDAFFDGYGLELPRQHSFCYLIRQRILETWAKTRLTGTGRTPQRELLERLEHRAEVAFA